MGVDGNPDSWTVRGVVDIGFLYGAYVNMDHPDSYSNRNDSLTIRVLFWEWKIPKDKVVAFSWGVSVGLLIAFVVAIKLLG